MHLRTWQDLVMATSNSSLQGSLSSTSTSSLVSCTMPIKSLFVAMETTGGGGNQQRITATVAVPIEFGPES